MLDPEMPAQEMRLHMGEMTAQEMRTARAAIRWANNVAGKSALKATRNAALEEAARVAERRYEAWQAGDGYADADGLHAVSCDVTACENIASAIRALKAAPADDGWRDIGTAPTDGTQVLLTWRAVVKAEEGPVSFITVGWWQEDFEAEWSEDIGNTIYRGTWTDGRVASWGYEEVRELSPTHWRPLPPPPGKEGS